METEEFKVCADARRTMCISSSETKFSLLVSAGKPTHSILKLDKKYQQYVQQHFSN